MNSPALIKPKNPMQQAAQNMMQSTATEFDAQVDFMILRISGVISRCGQGCG